MSERRTEFDRDQRFMCYVALYHAAGDSYFNHSLSVSVAAKMIEADTDILGASNIHNDEQLSKYGVFKGL